MGDCPAIAFGCMLVGQWNDEAEILAQPTRGTVVVAAAQYRSGGSDGWTSNYESQEIQPTARIRPVGFFI